MWIDLPEKAGPKEYPNRDIQSRCPSCGTSRGCFSCHYPALGTSRCTQRSSAHSVPVHHCDRRSDLFCYGDFDSQWSKYNGDFCSRCRILSRASCLYLRSWCAVSEDHLKRRHQLSQLTSGISRNSIMVCRTLSARRWEEL
jgi:hypothetical protein